MELNTTSHTLTIYYSTIYIIYRNLCCQNLSGPARQSTVCPVTTLVRSCQYCQAHKLSKLLSGVFCGMPTIQQEQICRCSKPIPGQGYNIRRTRRVSLTAKVHTTLFGVWGFVWLGRRGWNHHGCRQELSYGRRRLCGADSSAYSATPYQIAERDERDKAATAAWGNNIDLNPEHR